MAASSMVTLKRGQSLNPARPTTIGNQRRAKLLSYQEGAPRKSHVMREQAQGVVVPDPTEVLDSLEGDLDRIELWTTALSSFQHPAPAYQANTVRADKRMTVARNTVFSLVDVVRGAFESQPYIVVTVALGLGWLLGRTRR